MRTRLAWLSLIAALATAAPALAQAPAVPKSEKSAPPGEVAALILAGEESTLSSQMAGKISTIHVGLGEVFLKGEALIEFDCSEQRAQLQAADAEYRAARETHLARLRLQALGAAGELDVTLAAASVEKARSQVDFRRTQVAYCRVRAPFRGNVARLRVKPAESVPAGQALIDVVNPNLLKAQMFVPAVLGGVAAPRDAAHHPRQGNRPELSGARFEGEFARRRRQPAARSGGAGRQGQRRPAARDGRRRRVRAAAQALKPR